MSAIATGAKYQLSLALVNNGFSNILKFQKHSTQFPAVRSSFDQNAGSRRSSIGSNICKIGALAASSGGDIEFRFGTIAQKKGGFMSIYHPQPISRIGTRILTCL